DRLDAGERIDPVDVHRTRAAYAFAAGPAKGQCRVGLVLDLDQRVQDHRSAIVEIDRESIDDRVFPVVGVPAIDIEVAHARGARARSRFQIIDRSEMPRSVKLCATTSIRLTPSLSTSAVRNTAQLFCITRCMSRRISAVLRGPFECRTVSSRSTAASPAPFANGGWGVPGRTSSAARCAAARPKPTMSSRELEPSRL